MFIKLLITEAEAFPWEVCNRSVFANVAVVVVVTVRVTVAAVVVVVADNNVVVVAVVIGIVVVPAAINDVCPLEAFIGINDGILKYK